MATTGVSAFGVADLLTHHIAAKPSPTAAVSLLIIHCCTPRRIGWKLAWPSGVWCTPLDSPGMIRTRT